MAMYPSADPASTLYMGGLDYQHGLGTPVEFFTSQAPVPAAETPSEIAPAQTGAALTANQQAARRQLYTTAGIGALGAGLQLATQAIPTAQDRRNRERLMELQRLEQSGGLGLSGEERAMMEQALMGPVRTMAAEERARGEAAEASMGGTSAADLSRRRREAAQRVDVAGQRAGLAIGQAELQRAKEQLDELEQRTAYKAERQKGMLQTVAQTIGGLGPSAGMVRAAQAVPGYDLQPWVDKGFSPADAAIMAGMLQDPYTGGRIKGLISAGYTGGGRPIG